MNSHSITRETLLITSGFSSRLFAPAIASHFVQSTYRFSVCALIRLFLSPLAALVQSRESNRSSWRMRQSDRAKVALVHTTSRSSRRTGDRLKSIAFFLLFSFVSSSLRLPIAVAKRASWLAATQFRSLTGGASLVVLYTSLAA